MDATAKETGHGNWTGGRIRTTIGDMRGAKRNLLLIAGFVAAAALIVAIFPKSEPPKPDPPEPSADLCSHMMAIASDAQKMRYVKEFMAFKLRDPKFVESLRTSKSFDNGNDEIRKFDDMDWKYLGFLQANGAVEFNLPLDAAGGWDVDKIDAVRIWQLRAFILIRLGPAENSGLGWPPESLRELKAVGDDVFVYCRAGGTS